MTDREKVIKAFEFCLMPPSREELENDICSHEDCPYYREYNGGKCISAMASDALALLKAQEPRVMTLCELAFYDAGIFVETRNGCPEGLTDEVWPALVHLYCVSQNDEYGYVSFVNWNADTYDFEAKDYNVEFRCWTSHPTDKQREAIPWE